MIEIKDGEKNEISIFNDLGDDQCYWPVGWTRRYRLMGKLILSLSFEETTALSCWMMRGCCLGSLLVAGSQF